MIKRETQRPLKYPHRLNFYNEPPQDDITLEDFEAWAIDRMRILAEIEASFARNRFYKDISETTSALSRKYLPLNSTTAKSIDVDAERKKDHISHFVLRLAFCRSEELRYRFVKSEVTWFRIKWDGDDVTERSRFLESLQLGWIPVGEEERAQLLPDLLTASQIALPPGTTMNQYTENYYKVHWTKVPDLIEKRKVFLKNGFAYVPAREQASIVFQAFQVNLENQMMLTAKALPRLDEDNRILPILEHLSQGFIAGIASEYTAANPGDSVTAGMIDDLSSKHFPLCMRNLHDTLRKKHHLKHYGRLQYGLFLKIIGLSIEEAMVFWRKGFSGITDDKFNKEYKYNIRHSYGLEGKRTNYSAFSCQYIFTNHQPGVDDTHGCPYRHFSAENLQSALVTHFGNQGITPSVLPEIMQQVRSGHYHVACTRVFEITHGLKSGEGVGDGVSVTHPNEYAARSRELEHRSTHADNSAVEVVL